MSENEQEVDDAQVEVFTVGEDVDELTAAQSAARDEFGTDVLDADFEGAQVSVKRGEVLPVVAVVGRPNVGKSTFVNRVLGRREAVVEDRPGVTRDRVRYQAEWNDTRFWLVDTGGWDLRGRGIAADVAAQAVVAAEEADVVVLVVDATVGITDGDQETVDMLRKADVPILLVANKVDSTSLESDAAALWSLGLGEPHPVSALHGRGSGDFLDVLKDALPKEPKGAPVVQGPGRVALLGRPNVGKSSLLNQLAGDNRSVVDSVAGTTVDPVDELVEIDGEQWQLIDTAGIRRKAKTASGSEWYASLRTQTALDRSEVCIVLLDASEPVSEQDVRIINMVLESGRALVLAFNKWDLVDEDRRYELNREYDRDLAHVAWAPRINFSATTGWHTNRIGQALNTSMDGWLTRVPTGKLNQFVKELVGEHPHPVRGGKQARILFATQPEVGPPRFVLFTSGFLEKNYRRFFERRLREEFGFEGSPIRIDMRIREKRKRR